VKPAAPTRTARFGDTEDTVVVEEPLEIRVEGQPTAVTMRMPGDDLDLAIGFLTTEGVIGPDDPMSDIRAIAQVTENVVDVRLADGVSPSRARSADRTLFASSSCGICGKASIDRILRGRPRAVNRAEPPLEPRLEPRLEARLEPTDALLTALAAAFDAAQVYTHSTGCVHAAALFDAAGAVVLLREDVGRHNAVDKVLGAHIRADQAFEGLGLAVTSRAGFEVVQKAITVGIGLVCTLGAPTSLAIDVAAEADCTLVGWLRPGRWRRFT